jgi:diguanylate cyclase (GGDEF)-like protein
MISSAVVLVISCFTALVMSGVLFVIARNFPKKIHGLNQWYWSSLILALTLPLFLARGHIPEFLSIVVANLMVLVCFMMMSFGTRKFTGVPLRNNNIQLILFVAAFVLLFMWFTYIQPNVAARVACLSLFTLIVTFDQLLLVLKALPNSTGRNMLIFALCGLILTRLIRLGSLASGYDQPTNVFDSSPSQLIFLATPAIMIPLATISYIMLAAEKLHQSLEFMSQHDDLTECLNKKTAIAELGREIHRTKRYKHPLSIMMIDLDNFKQINDAYGHLEGDRVLIDFAKKAKGAVRETDLVSRFGGDEFLIVLPDTALKEAMLLAERIHKAGTENKPAIWSVSIGVSVWQGQDDSLDALLTRADKSLYLSKALGKNQTQVTQNLSSEFSTI